jgi:small subunit ribosomal protein S1
MFFDIFDKCGITPFHFLRKCVYFMEQSAEQPTQQPEWFENFIANYDTQNPNQGDILQATVIRNDEEGIFLDCGLKREIIVPQRDLENLSKEAMDKLIPGSHVPVLVITPASENREIEISLSRGLEQQIWEKAKTSMENGDILSLEVVDHNRGGLLVQYENLRGFVPYSLVPELRGVRNPKRAEGIKNSLIGKTIDVKITEVDPDRRRLILSAESAQAELRQRLLEKFKKGDILTGRVVKVVDFGAFVDLGGIDGLIHVSQLAWKKVKHPSDVIKVGEEIEVKIIDVDRDRQRIGLSRKALLPGPWQTLGEELKAGDYVEGIVTRLVDFGAFAKLPQGVEGLIHTSQIGYSAHQDPQNAIKPGDRVLLKVLDLKPERKRVALSMRQVPMDRQIAWAMEKMDVLPEETDQVSEPSVPEQTIEDKNEAADQTEKAEIEQSPITDETESLERKEDQTDDQLESGEEILDQEPEQSTLLEANHIQDPNSIKSDEVDTSEEHPSETSTTEESFIKNNQHLNETEAA